MSSSSSLGAVARAVGGSAVGDSSVTLRDATHDSRQAGPGTLFIAVPGFVHDGHDYVPAAVDRGATAVMVERALPGVAVPQIVVESCRAAMAPAAAMIHGHPSRRLALVGVTGTNGKTTVTHMLEAMAGEAGRSTGLIGTIRTRAGDEDIPSVRTTPEATDFQRILGHMAGRGVEVVAAEVSSHALELGRVDATEFAVSAFTNLGRDHLDFHGSLEAYFAAKARLFEPHRSKRAVVCVDGPHGRTLADTVSIPVLTVGTGAGADVRGRIVDAAANGSVVELEGVDGLGRLTVPVGGDVNVLNALVALGCCLSLGLDPVRAAAGLATLGSVPGRFELVSGEHPVAVIVDYAHTPEGISAAIRSARAVVTGRILVVFGAGGDRDHEKRPHMGAAAVDADRVVVTSDNPRSEDPDAIIDQIMEGIPGTTDVARIADRRLAIRSALAEAGPGDAVLILGKGHERGQERQGGVEPFDDRLVAREELAGLEEGRR